MLSVSPLPACRAGRLLLASVVALVVLGFASGSIAQQAPPPAPKVSDQPLTAEQLGVYKFILTHWMYDGKSPLNLIIQTDAFSMEDASDAQACLKGLDLEPYDPAVVHRFRLQDLPQLNPVHLQLVEREAQQKVVEENDPSRLIQRGKSVEEAVKSGFDHGYAWVTEIRCDKSHTHAVVSYGFHCGGLCGNGGTAILEKTDGVWKIKGYCSNWIS